MVLLVLIVASFLWRTVVLIFAPLDAGSLYSGTFSRIDALAAGGLASYLFRHGPEQTLRKFSGAAAFFLVVSVFILYVVLGHDANDVFAHTLGYSINAFAFASLILWAALSSKAHSTALLRVPRLRYLGKISYGTYLLQLPVQSALKIGTHSSLGPSVRTPTEVLIWFAAIIAVASISWRFFEKPVLDWGTKMSAETDGFAAIRRFVSFGGTHRAADRYT